jgi:hypothetical protein
MKANRPCIFQVPTKPRVGTLKAYAQCGGKSGPGRGPFGDFAFASRGGAACTTGYGCIRSNEWCAPLHHSDHISRLFCPSCFDEAGLPTLLALYSPCMGKTLSAVCCHACWPAQCQQQPLMSWRVASAVCC